jgi:hypothetical protein
MADWAGLQEWAREKYELENDEDDWFGVTLEYADGRSQKVVVTHFTFQNADWAEIRSPICEESELAPKVALKKNAEFAVGGIGLKDGKYYLFYSVPLEDLSEGEFEVPLNVIAASADGLEETYSGGDEH